MKNKVLILAGLLLLCVCILNAQNTNTNDKNQMEGTIKIMTSSDYYNLANCWVTDFKKQYPGVTVELLPISGNDVTKLTETDICLTTLENKQLKTADYWKMPVGKDVIVPIINSQSSNIEKLYKQGITKQKLAEILSAETKQNWNSVLDGAKSVKINVYITDNAMVNNTLLSYLNITSINIIKVANVSEFIDKIKNDASAIGFCKMNDIIDVKTMQIVNNISIIPIDKNENGIIDPYEMFYKNPNEFARGVWMGKYPKALCSDIYAFANTKPENKIQLAFLSYLLNQGQTTLSMNGYNELTILNRQKELNALNGTEYIFNAEQEPKTGRAVFIVVCSFLALILILGFSMQYLSQKKSTFMKSVTNAKSVFNENTVLSPKGIYFDKSHTWTYMETSGIVKTGIDDFLQHTTGPITQIKLRKNTGDKIQKGERVLTLVQKGKHLNISSPVSGVMQDTNQALLSNPGLINKDPYYDGWIYSVEPTNWQTELRLFLMSDDYKTWLKREFTRLKDFIAKSVQTNQPQLSPVILQDGGELTDNTLENSDPKVWEDFQRDFIDTSVL